MEPIPLDEIEAAAVRIAGVAVKTPVLTSSDLDARLGATVFCKAEALQRGGAFKFRGAYNRISQIPIEDRPKGVVTTSSGNHGASVAIASQLLGIPATIHIPDPAPAPKVALIRAAGAEIRTFPKMTKDRESGAKAQVAETGATFVHPYEDRQVMAGQGTAALELHHEVGALDVFMAPMSGGGLMAGCASAIHALDPNCVIIGVEPSIANDTQQSFARGERVTIDPPDTIADGLAVTSPGENTFPINRELVSEVLTVTEEQIVEAMHYAWDHLGVVVEPSGAVCLAALLVDPGRWAGKRIGLILSGGNLDRTQYPGIG
jgi:threonine dehydratase